MSEGADWIMFRNMIKLIVLDIIQSAPSDKHIIKSYLIPSFSINSFGRLVIKMEEYLERFDSIWVWYDIMTSCFMTSHIPPFHSQKLKETIMAQWALKREEIFQHPNGSKTKKKIVSKSNIQFIWDLKKKYKCHFYSLIIV